MSDTTTHMTDFMEQVLKEEYERHEADGEIKEFFDKFAHAQQRPDKEPVWAYSKIQAWIREFFESMGGFDKLPQMMQWAIDRDIDKDYLADWLNEKHATWWEEQHDDNLTQCSECGWEGHHEDTHDCEPCADEADPNELQRPFAAEDSRVCDPC